MPRRRRVFGNFSLVWQLGQRQHTRHHGHRRYFHHRARTTLCASLCGSGRPMASPRMASGNMSGIMAIGKANEICQQKGLPHSHYGQRGGHSQGTSGDETHDKRRTNHSKSLSGTWLLEAMACLPWITLIFPEKLSQPHRSPDHQPPFSLGRAVLPKRLC